MVSSILLKMRMKVCFVTLCLIAGSSGLVQMKGQSGEDLRLSAYYENITVISADSGFLTQITVTGKSSVSDYYYPVYYDEKLQEVTHIKLCTKSGNRFKEYKNPEIIVSPLDLNFHSSGRIKIIKTEPGKEFTLTYELRCRELLYFSGMAMFSSLDIDTAYYAVTIPRDLSLAYDVIYRDSLDYFTIDTLKEPSLSTYSFKTRPLKTKRDPLVEIGIYSNLHLPFMRALVVPSAYKGKEALYFNNWYLEQINAVTVLDSVTRSSIDQLTAGIHDDYAIMDTLYNVVRNFKYVDIEVGMGAFVPHNVNLTYAHRQGDCKDLSSLLCRSLQYKGIDAGIALASTFNHISDADFPSLSCFNHEICVVSLNGRKVLLDPTVTAHTTGYPVPSLQGRTIFITGTAGGEFYYVEPVAAEINKAEYNISMKPLDENLSGTFRIQMKGFSGNAIRDLFHSGAPAEYSKGLSKYLENLFHDQRVSNIKSSVSKDEVMVEGDLVVKNKYIRANQSGDFLFIDFIPILFDLGTEVVKLSNETYLGMTVNKTIFLTVDFGKMINNMTYEPFSLTGDRFSSSLSCEKINDHTIRIDYHLLYNNIWINAKDIPAVNNLIEALNKKTNEPIILR